MLVEVILPQYLPFDLTYSVSDTISHLVSLGVRVEVPSGKKGISTAVVSKILNSQEEENFLSVMEEKNRTIREIYSVIDTNPIITPNQINLWRWISDYYISSVGEVMSYFLPKELIVKGSVDGATKKYRKNGAVVKRKVVEVVADADLSSSRSLLARYIYKSDKESFIYSDLRVAGFTSSQIKALADKGLVSVRDEMVVKELDVCNNVADSDLFTDMETPPYQDDIDGLLDKPLLIISPQNSFTLMNNYIFMINRELSRGNSVLYLNVEGSVSVNSLMAIFGDRCVNFNSKLSVSNRVKSYSRIINERSLLVIGDRKSLGLPFSNLSLIIIAEEHSKNYRSENTPRFMGRDVALMLAYNEGARVVMNSFAPTLESYHNSQIDKYNLLEIENDRTNNTKLSVIDKYSIASKERKTYGNIPTVRYFSKLLLEKMEGANDTLLFHNRRGYNNFLICGDCNWVLRCPHCNVSMTYHHGKRQFICHYCNKKVEPVLECMECGSKNIKLKGIGSENIEASIKKHFPMRDIVRIDSDTVSDAKENRNRLEAVHCDAPKIVIGTQLALNILKDNRFGVVGVIDCDTLFNAGEFRAEENVYRTLTQLKYIASGGDLVVQCSDINRPILRDVDRGDYYSMAQRELAIRETFSYPPYVRLLRITVRDRVEDTAYEMAQMISDKIKLCGVGEVSEPNQPVVDKIKDEYLFQIVVKLPKRGDNSDIKRRIRSIVEGLTKNRIIEVDI